MEKIIVLGTGSGITITGKNYETANMIGIKGRRIIANQVDNVKKLLEEFEVII